ncbi:MAG: hypothetical protein ACI8ZB_003024 [Desulforhopalus sp.]|jgi:hypothetical protein
MLKLEQNMMGVKGQDIFNPETERIRFKLLLQEERGKSQT